MKKIFTLIFSLGLLTSAFAQSEHRQQKQPQGNGYQTSQYSRDGHQDKNSSNTYSNGRDNQWNNKDNRDQYAYNRNERNDTYRDRNEHFLQNTIAIKEDTIVTSTISRQQDFLYCK